MTRNDPFLIRDFVAGFDAIAHRFSVLSQASYNRFEVTKDIAYGQGPRQRLDILRDGPGTGRPVHMFIHGGYWRAGDKQDYAFIADTVIAAGGVAVIVGYDLMPATRMGAIIDQIRAAFAWVCRNGESFGGDVSRITVSGHSAGAQLASWLAATRANAPGQANLDTVPVGLLMVSGLYDLAPIRQSFLQSEINLGAQEAADGSPIHSLPALECRRIIAVGGDETPPFHQQAAQYLGHLKASGGERGEAMLVTGCNHMDVVLELGNPQQPLGRALVDLIEFGG